MSWVKISGCDKPEECECKEPDPPSEEAPDIIQTTRCFPKDCPPDSGISLGDTTCPFDGDVDGNTDCEKMTTLKTCLERECVDICQLIYPQQAANCVEQLTGRSVPCTTGSIFGTGGVISCFPVGQYVCACDLGACRVMCGEWFLDTYFYKEVAPRTCREDCHCDAVPLSGQGEANQCNSNRLGWWFDVPCHEPTPPAGFLDGIQVGADKNSVSIGRIKEAFRDPLFLDTLPEESRKEVIKSCNTCSGAYLRLAARFSKELKAFLKGDSA